jgi:hypothetical protein
VARLRLGAAALLAGAALVASSAAGAATTPAPVFSAIHGRIAGWARSGPNWFAVYVAGVGGDWCGLQGATWRMALVSSSTGRVVAERRIAAGMCGNSLGWVRGGRFSDGEHAEVAFQLWATPSIGATTWIYRIAGRRLTPLAHFAGDRVTLGAGTVRVAFENRGRSAHGELEDDYRFENGRYRLVRRR